MKFFTNIKQYYKNQISENSTTNLKEPVYLTKQKDNELQYKIYRDLGTGYIQIETGIVGGNSTITTAPISTWDDKIRHDRTRKYSKVSSLDINHVNTATTGTPDIPHTAYTGSGVTANIKSKYGQKTLDKLQQHDSHGVKLVLSNEVEVNTNGKVKVLSKDLINDYKNLISQLEIESKNNNLIAFNRILVKMNKIIKKKNTLSNILLKDPNEMNNQILKEKELLEAYLEMSIDDFDKLETKSIKDKIDSSVVLKKVSNITDIIIEDIDDNDKNQILKLLSFNNEEWRYIDAVKIINNNTQKLFDNEISKSKNKTTKLLFHGSRVRNWMSIIKNGLKINNAGSNAGTLFDNGIYFADIADKSLGYVDGGRWDRSSNIDIAYLAIYEVHTGKYAEYSDVKNINNIKLHNWVPENNFDSYWAKSRNFHPATQADGKYNLARDEYIIYDDNKCTIKYLVEIKK